MTEYLDLADYLLIAEAVLGVAAENIARWPGIGLAESALHAPAAGLGGVELYPDVIDEVAVLCVRLARNHPAPGREQACRLPLDCSSSWPATASSGCRLPLTRQLQ